MQNRTILIFSLGFIMACLGPSAAQETYIDVCVGEDFVISLESNPTTGYTWSATFDGDALNLTNETDVRHPHPPGWVGVGGMQLFTFVAKKAGETEVTMDYARPWENESIETRLFTVRVADNNTTQLKAKAGDPFQVSLGESPSTGFKWSADFDKGFLELKNETYESYLPEDYLPRMGGRRIFEFSPLKRGETDLTMTLSSSGEVAKEWLFRVDVS